MSFTYFFVESIGSNIAEPSKHINTKLEQNLKFEEKKTYQFIKYAYFLF